ncbi:hypothetical protein ABIC65_001465 [Sphingomonas trueperi]
MRIDDTGCEVTLSDALNAYVFGNALDGPGFSTEPILAALDPHPS